VASRFESLQAWVGKGAKHANGHAAGQVGCMTQKLPCALAGRPFDEKLQQCRGKSGLPLQHCCLFTYYTAL
jgi:hypothetical protein